MIALPKIRTNGKKRLGRGYGSGKGGHTSSRGQKGQKARRNLGVLFEGVKTKKSFIKRLPFRRGKAKFKAINKSVTVSLRQLTKLPKGSTEINLRTLTGAGIISKTDAKRLGVKIVGGGEIKNKYNITLPISKSAAKVVEAAGGKILDTNLKKARLQTPNTKEKQN